MSAPGGILSGEEAALIGRACRRHLPLPGSECDRLAAIFERCPNGARLEALPSDAELAEAVAERHVGVIPEPDVDFSRILPPAEEPPFDPGDA